MNRSLTTLVGLDVVRGWLREPFPPSMAIWKELRMIEAALLMTQHWVHRARTRLTTANGLFAELRKDPASCRRVDASLRLVEKHAAGLEADVAELAELIRAQLDPGIANVEKEASVANDRWKS